MAVPASEYVMKVTSKGSPNPPMTEDNSGAYYYKYSWYKGVMSAKTDVSLKNVQLKFASTSQPTNNAYIFLNCFGTLSTPVEYGIFAPANGGGRWYIYYRNGGQGVQNTYVVAARPDVADLGTGVYTYKNVPKITIQLSLSGFTNPIVAGKIFVTDTGASLETPSPRNLSASACNVTANATSFTCGVSHVPDPQKPASEVFPRNSYLLNVDLGNGQLYPNSNYGGTPCIWQPDAANALTYYNICVRSTRATCNRFGTNDERISIDNR